MNGNERTNLAKNSSLSTPHPTDTANIAEKPRRIFQKCARHTIGMPCDNKLVDSRTEDRPEWYTLASAAKWITGAPGRVGVLVPGACSDHR